MWQSETGTTLNTMLRSNSGSKTNLSENAMEGSDVSLAQKSATVGEGPDGSKDLSKGWGYGGDRTTFAGTDWLNNLGDQSGKTEEDKAKSGQGSTGSSWSQPGSGGGGNLWNPDRNADASLESSLVSGIWDKGNKTESSMLWGNSSWGNEQPSSSLWEPPGKSDVPRPGDSNVETKSLWNNAESKQASGETTSSGAMFSDPLFQQSQSVTSTTASGGASAVGRPQSKDDLISKFVNSHEGWGKTPIRQDTPWDLTEEPRPPPIPDSAVRRQRLQSSSNGVAIWESTRTTSVSESGSSDATWDSDNEGMGHQWNRNSESSMSRSMSRDEHMGGTTSSLWNDGSSQVKTETGFWEDVGESSGGSGARSVYDSTINQWEENTQDSMKRGAGGGDSRQQQWQKPDKQNMWGEGGSVGNWGDSAPSGGGQQIDDGTSSWGQTPSQERSDHWGGGDGGSKQRASPVDWNSQSNWNAQQRKFPPTQQQMPGRLGGPTQMRSQMLQDLVRRGFKKEEAQEALIRHNMDFDNALAELSSIASGQHMGMGGDMMKGRKLVGAGSDSGFDSHMDPMGRMMPPIGMQQQQGMGGPPSFPNTAIPPPMPGFQGMQPNVGPHGQQFKGMQQGMMGGKDMQGVNGLQMQQQQLLQQLQQAVQQGQISSSQLAQYQQNPSQMVNIGNLAQLNNLLQRLLAEHQQLQGVRNNPQQQMQLEKLAFTIQQVRAQIKQQQLHILSQTSLQQGVPGGKPGMGGHGSGFPPTADLASAMNTMSMRDSGHGADSMHMPKWNMPSPDKDAPTSGGRFSSLGGPVGGAGPHVPYGGDFAAKGPAAVSGLTHNVSAPDLLSQGGGEAGSQAGSLDIEEFVPGRKWQGMDKKTDDDPYLTPAQMANRFSMNRVGDDYVMNTLGKTQSASDIPAMAGQMKQQQWQGGAIRPAHMMQQQVGPQAGNQRQWNNNMSPGQQSGLGQWNITWLLLTNVGPHVDANMLKMSGACKLKPIKMGVMLVGFSSQEGASRAYAALQAASARGPKVSVELVPEAAVQQLLTMVTPWDDHPEHMLGSQ